MKIDWKKATNAGCTFRKCVSCGRKKFASMPIDYFFGMDVGDVENRGIEKIQGLILPKIYPDRKLAEHCKIKHGLFLCYECYWRNFWSSRTTSDESKYGLPRTKKGIMIDKMRIVKSNSQPTTRATTITGGEVK